MSKEKQKKAGPPSGQTTKKQIAQKPIHNHWDLDYLLPKAKTTDQLAKDEALNTFGRTIKKSF